MLMLVSVHFVRYLVVLLKIPVFILCDADPHGIDIMAQYKYGSRTTAPNNAHLTLPPVYWLGIWPSEIDSMHISDDCLLDMTDNDLNKVISHFLLFLDFLRSLLRVTSTIFEFCCFVSKILIFSSRIFLAKYPGIWVSNADLLSDIDKLEISV